MFVTLHLEVRIDRNTSYKYISKREMSFIPDKFKIVDSRNLFSKVRGSYYDVKDHIMNIDLGEAWLSKELVEESGWYTTE